MHSDESLSSDDAANFFKECLREKGLESAQVTHSVPSGGFLDEFYIRKRINREEELTYRTTFDLSTNAKSVDIIRKKLALEAENIANKFKEKLVTTFEWDERCVEVSPYDGGWARCVNCNTRVDAPEAQYLITEGCELSDPMPVHRDMTHELENMAAHQKILFKMYLIGLLRERCEPSCRNHKYNDLDKSPAYLTERFK